MNITLNTQISPTGDLIIPVVQTDALADQLNSLAQRLNVSASVLKNDFKADAKEVLALYNKDGAKTYLLGVGADPQEIDWLRAFRKLVFDQKSKLSAQVNVDLTAVEGVVAEPPCWVF